MVVASNQPPARKRQSASVKYEIRDASGALVAIHKRTDGPDGGKRMSWLKPDGKPGLDAQVADLPLYGSQLLGDREGEVVVIAEGEKDADALIDAGILGLGTVTGAHSAPGRGPLAELGDRRVVLWPDADQVGYEHMKRVAKGLKGIAREVRWISVPDAQKGDGAADVAPDDRRRLVEAAGPVPTDERFERQGLGYVGQWSEGVEVRVERLRYSSGDLKGMLQVSDAGGSLMYAQQNLSSITSRKTAANYLSERSKASVDWREVIEVFCTRVIEAESAGSPIVTVGRLPRREADPFLLNPILPLGRATILYAAGGTGKSLLAAAIAQSVASGHSVIDRWHVSHPAPVLILDWEADEDEWNERIQLVANGVAMPPAEIHYRSCIGSLAEQVTELSRYIAQAGIGLVVVDSVGMATPSAREGGDANEGALRLFQALRELRTTSLLVDHVKGEDLERESAVYKPYGSVYKANLARSTYELRRMSEDADGVIHLALYHRKVNRGPKQQDIGLAYSFGTDDSLLIQTEPLDGFAVSGMAHPDRIYRYLLAVGAATVGDIAEACDIEAASARVALNRGKRFQKQSDGRWAIQSDREFSGP